MEMQFPKKNIINYSSSDIKYIIDAHHGQNIFIYNPFAFPLWGVI